MPISKKPRKKTPAKAGSPEKTSAPPPLPDRRGMEAFMAGLLGRHQGNDPTDAAQGLIYEVWETSSPAKRIALARKALKLSPVCADAYVLLAEEAAISAEEELNYYQRGVEAGEIALGPDGFEEYAGHFWGFLETRPYMRARAGLADVLWRLGQHQKAIGHWQEMLKLNPNDNQGVRYVLAGHLLTLGSITALKTLIRQYEEDGSAMWLYTQVLLAFRDNDPDAEKLTAEAWIANSHVPGVLSGRQPVVVSRDGYITMGGADEAGEYVKENLRAWQTTAGAIEWLTRVTAALSPRRKGRAAR